MNRKRILHGAGMIVLLALVVPFVIYAVPGVVGADQSYVILSGSMEPAMSPGDAVVVEETDPTDIEAGDVITFVRDGSDTAVTHRVVDVREENGQRVFETKGDANDNPDREAVPESAVVGTVTLTIPLIGYVVHFVNTPLGFATTVLLPLGLLAVSEAWTFARDVIQETDDGSIQAGDDGTDDRTGVADDPGQRVTADGQDGADGAAADATPGDATGDDADEPSGVVVDATDLVATTAILVGLVPYAAYVALELQTLPTIAIAYTVGFTALALVAIQAGARVRGRRTGADHPGAGTDGARDGATEPRDVPAEADGVGDDADRPVPSEPEAQPVEASEFEWPKAAATAETEGEES